MPRLETPRLVALGSGGLLLWADIYGSAAQRLQREDVEDNVYVVLSQNGIMINSIILPADKVFDVNAVSSCDDTFFGAFAARYNARFELIASFFPVTSSEQQYEIQAFITERNGHVIVSKWDYKRDRVVF